MPTFNEFGDRISGHSSDEDDRQSARMSDSASAPPAAEQNIYGDAEILFEEEDQMPIETPLIAPVVDLKLDLLPDKDLSPSELEYLEFQMSQRPHCVALLGPHSSGKTSLADFLVASEIFDCTKDQRYRRMTLHAQAGLAIGGEISGKSFPVHVVDLPGHPAFLAETRLGATLADSALLVVDVISGIDDLTLMREISDKFPIKLVLAKIDRLAIELRVGPDDAFAIIRRRIDEVNQALFGDKIYFSPLKGNVFFASTKLGFIFSVASWTQSIFGNSEIPATLLWGDFFFNSETSEVVKGPAGWTAVPTFVAFVLEPLWKVIAASACSGELWKWTRKFLGLKYPKTAVLDAKKIFSDIFANSNASCLWVGVPVVATPQASEQDRCVVLVTPSHRHDFRLVRVLRGTLSDTATTFKGLNGSVVEVDELKISLITSGGRVTLPRAQEGAVVLANVLADPGVYVVGPEPEMGNYRKFQDEISGFLHKNGREACVCLDVETADVDALQAALKKVKSTRPGMDYKLMELGACRISGTQELHLDQTLREVRSLGASFKVADPCVVFAETCGDTSASLASGVTANKKLRLELFAEPLETEISQYLDTLREGEAPIESELIERGMDKLSAKSIVAIRHGNILLDETISDLDSVSQVSAQREALISGFDWAVSEGPLIGERIRGVKFRVVSLTTEAARVPPGQVVPLARRLCHEALLSALPRISEPVFAVHVLAATEKIAAMVGVVLSKRRGSVTSETPKPGTPFVEISGRIPALEAFGFETDLRMASGNGVVVTCRFETHQRVPGDPTDATIPIKALAVVPSVWLGRDVFVKVRRQKRMNLDL